jgi:hypothetical protein
MAVSSYRYQRRRPDEPLRTRLVELAREKPCFGYRRLCCWAARGSMLTTSECIGVSGRIDDPEEEGETLRPRVGQPLRVWAAANHK